MNKVYVKGTIQPKERRKSKQFGKGRICSEDKCEQVLSIYNDNKQCFLHAPKKQPRIRGRLHPNEKK